MNLLVETNERLRNQQSWRKKSLCSLTPRLTPWFTADNVPPEVRKEMRALCAECPVRAQCELSANGLSGNPRATAGFWAGRSYNQWGGTGD